MKDNIKIDDLMETVRTGGARPLQLFEQEAPPKKPEDEEDKDTGTKADSDIPDAPPGAAPPPDFEGGKEAEVVGGDDEKPAADDEKPAAGDAEEGDDIVAALNAQHNHELTNFYKYYKASAWLDDLGFNGMAAWMMSQAKGELEHAEKIFHYLLDRNQQLVLADIKAPQADWKVPLDVFKFTHQTEMETTDRLERLHQMADDQHDRQTMAFIDWFLQEQVEEEAVTLLMVQRLERIGDDGSGLNALDYELAEELKGGVAAARLREDRMDEGISVTVNNNLTEVNIGKATFWFSYKTCIAFDTPSTGLVASENAWSTTTGKHINQVQPDKKKRLPRKDFEEQLEHVISGVGLREDKEEELRTSQNTPKVDQAIQKAAKKFMKTLSPRPTRKADLSTFFEHDHWWIRVYDAGQDDEYLERTFDVNDAEGPGTFDGFDFEEVGNRRLRESLDEEKSPLEKRLPGAYDTIITWLRDITVERRGEVSLDDLKNALATDRRVRGLRWEMLLKELEFGIAHQDSYPLTIEWGPGKKSLINYVVKG